MEFWQVMESRHSVRAFRPDPVSRELVERVLHAACLAPSAMNEQPWRFYVATGSARAQLGELITQSTIHLADYMDVLGPERYAEVVQWHSTLGDAPVVIAVSVLKSDNEFQQANRYLSVGAALENVLLAVAAEGLSACNVTISFWIKDEIAELLGVDDTREIAAVIALGRPLQSDTPSPIKNEDIVVWRD